MVESKIINKYVHYNFQTTRMTVNSEVISDNDHCIMARHLRSALRRVSTQSSPSPASKPRVNEYARQRSTMTVYSVETDGRVVIWSWRRQWRWWWRQRGIWKHAFLLSSGRFLQQNSEMDVHTQTAGDQLPVCNPILSLSCSSGRWGILNVLSPFSKSSDNEAISLACRLPAV